MLPFRAIQSVRNANELSPNLGDGPRPEGSGGGGLGLRERRFGGDFDPVREPDTLNEFGQLVWPSIVRQLFCAPPTNLNTMAHPLLFARQPLHRIFLRPPA